MGRFLPRPHYQLCKIVIAAVTIIITLAFSISQVFQIPDCEMLDYFMGAMVIFWFGRGTKGLEK